MLSFLDFPCRSLCRLPSPDPCSRDNGLNRESFWCLPVPSSGSSMTANDYINCLTLSFGVCSNKSSVVEMRIVCYEERGLPHIGQRT